MLREKVLLIFVGGGGEMEETEWTPSSCFRLNLAPSMWMDSQF